MFPTGLTGVQAEEIRIETVMNTAKNQRDDRFPLVLSNQLIFCFIWELFAIFFAEDQCPRLAIYISNDDLVAFN